MNGFRLGVFSTFRDDAAIDLFKSIYTACQKGIIRGSVAFVFCNREEGESASTDRYLARVEEYGVPIVRVSSKKFRPEERRDARGDPDLMNRWRIAYDEAGPKAAVEEYGPDLIVLAGYMLILGGEMCREWRMINLHPALPWGPTGAWEEVVWELMKTGATETGTMIHLVTEDLDRGAPVSFCRVSLEELQPMWTDWRERLRKEAFDEIKKAEYRTNGLLQAIRERQLPGEIPLLLLTLKYISNDTIEIRDGEEGRSIRVNGSPCPMGMDLGREVESALSKPIL